MDGFTAKCLIAMAEEDSNAAADLYKSLKTADDSGGPSNEARAFFEKHKGKLCLIDGTCYTGIIEKLNESTGGFYPGERYPIYVRITKSSDFKFELAVGTLFEYGLDQLTILEEVQS